MPISDLACHSCRKRKVKCDRALPQCAVCSQTGQTCNYPLRSMKPGPKIGSLQKHKRSRHVNGIAQKRQNNSRYSLPNDPDSAHDAEFEALDDGPEKESSVHADGAWTNGGDRQRSSRLNIHDLSFILHPSHESTTPDRDPSQSQSSRDGGQTGLCRQACAELGVSQTLMNQIIRVFFDNMVAVNLFHEPSFAKKLSNVPSLWELTALFSAIAGYASRFLNQRSNVPVDDGFQPGEINYQPTYFVDLAFNYVNKALMECGDEMPPLCVIQALIIATHCQLTRGVHGKAWRSLGLCVSLIYETGMHLLDSGTAARTADPQQWQADEEKRRAFWAIWEMDVFASTIRRTPTAINWQQMEILLPVDNSHWFSGNPTPSCFLESEPSQRWKVLQDSGNQSPKAWFIVINSLMKTAQITADFRRTSAIGNPSRSQFSHRASTPELIMEIRQKLETLANAVRCFNLALPDRLRYRDQYLAFGAPVQRQAESQRQLHCSIYNIFIMTQLSRLMIYRYDAFRPQSRQSEIKGRHRAGDSTGRGTFNDAENVALRQYFDAADCILKIVDQSCEEHIKHINPFLSSTIWLAAAVQLVRKHFARDPSNSSLIRSRFDILYLTYKRCVHFWDTQTALQRNLESLEEQLEARRRKPDTHSRQPSQDASKRTLDEAGANRQSSSKYQADQVEHHAKRQRTQIAPHTAKQTDSTSLPPTRNPREDPPAQYLPESPIIPSDAPPPAHDGLRITTENYTRQPPAAPESIAMLNSMGLAQPSRDQISEAFMMPANPDFLDSMDLENDHHDQALEWDRLDFLGGIHDLLAGWAPY